MLQDEVTRLTGKLTRAKCLHARAITLLKCIQVKTNESRNYVKPTVLNPGLKLNLLTSYVVKFNKARPF